MRLAASILAKARWAGL